MIPNCVRPAGWMILLCELAWLGACRVTRSPDDPGKLKTVLRGYFEGIEQKDTLKMRSVTTEDFILYEGGSVWNNDSAFKNIRRNMPFTVKYHLDQFKVYVDDHSGYMTYFNHADFVFRDSVRESIDWIESATFLKTAGGWKMNFLEATERDPKYDTIRYLKKHYEARVKEFSREPVRSGGMIFLGNSITEYADWKVLTGDSLVLNRGIAADNTFGVLDRLPEVIARRPDRLIIEIGINDIGQNIPVPLIARNIYSIVARVTAGSPMTKVYVLSVLPTNEQAKKDYPEVYGKNGQVFCLDEELRRNADRRGFVFIDLKSRVSDADGGLDIRYARPDGLHLNQEGYRVLIRMLRDRGYL
jgi:lysophospholipase L1-like esterase